MSDSGSNAGEEESETTEKILAVATDLFSEKGFEATRMDEVAHRAEVNKATIYYHYESKKELYGAVLLEPLGEIAEEFQSNHPPGEVSSSQQLKEQLRFILRKLDNHPEVANMLLRQIINGGKQLPEPAQTIIERVWIKFGEIVQNCRVGVEAKRVPVERIQKMIVGALLLNTLDSDFFPEGAASDLSLRDVDEEFVELLLSGVVE